MIESWRNWCRLCAKIDSFEVDFIYKVESISDHLEIIKKYFMISLSDLDDVQLPICLECWKFLTKVDGFRDNCIKVNQMFREIISQEESSTISDLESFRIKFGIDNNEIKFSAYLSQNVEGSREDSLLPDIFAEPLEMQSTVEFKSEMPEIEDPASRRQCSRLQNSKSSSMKHNRIVMMEHEYFDDKTDHRDVDEISDREFEYNRKEQISKEENTNGKINLPRKQIGEKRERQCSFCFKVFTRRNTLMEHILVKHRRDQLTYVCSKCSKTFCSAYRLKLHDSVHLSNAQKRTHPCSFCNRIFKTKNNLQKHINCIHIDKQRRDVQLKEEKERNEISDPNTMTQLRKSFLICAFCSKTFKRKNFLEQHILSKHQQKTMAHKCSKVSYTRAKLKIHRDKIHKVKNRSSSRICSPTSMIGEKIEEKSENLKDSEIEASQDKEVSNNETVTDIVIVKEEYKSHIRLSKQKTKDRNTVNVFQNQTEDNEVIINKKGSQRKQRKRNKKGQEDKTEVHGSVKDTKELSVKRPWERNRECSFCSKTFKRRNALREHILSRHSRQDMTHLCSKCPKKFSAKYRLRLHELTHLSKDERRKYQCPHCHSIFMQKGGLQSHINSVHLGDKPFICEECGKGFGTKGALISHKLTHSDDRPFACSVCQKKFKSKRNCQDHETTHSGSGYPCTHCNLVLKSKGTHWLHMRVHSNVKKYKCNYCGNEYKHSQTLKDHLIWHTGQRPYECPFCDKTFSNGSNYRSHKNKAHAAELAAMKASGQQLTAPKVPRLEHLQPKVPIQSGDG